VARKLEFKYSAFVIPLTILMPEYMKTSYSGLTEIVFAFLFILSAYLFLKEKYVVSYTIISFLPFCRPDGNAVIAMVGLISLLHPVYRRYILYLITGHLVITIIGVFFFNENWMWLITKNPNTYHEFNSSNGGWLSYIRGLRSFMSMPIYILFWLGILHFFIQFIKAEKKITLEFFLYFIAFTLFAMHTILYKFSLFRSIGLLRYLVPIAPILAILCLKGFSVSIDILDKLKIKRVVSCILLISILFIYAFSPAKYSLHYPQIFDLNPTQKLSINVYDFIKKEFPKSSLIYYSYPYFSILSGHNPYDWDLHRYIDKKRIREEIPKGSLIIWDNWYCVEDFGITPEKILAISSISEIKKFEIVHGKTKSSFIVFLKE
jgi:hypothetical protein